MNAQIPGKFQLLHNKIRIIIRASISIIICIALNTNWIALVILIIHLKVMTVIDLKPQKKVFTVV